MDAAPKPMPNRLLRVLAAGLAGALSAFAMPVATAPAKQAPVAKSDSAAQAGEPR